MKKFFSLILLTSLPLCADTLGNVEYHLPAQIAHEWKMARELDRAGSTYALYTPNGASEKVTDELFFVVVSSKPIDIATLATGLSDLESSKQLSPEGESFIESDSNSLIFESECENWSEVKNENGEPTSSVKHYALARIFSTDKGSVMLTYSTKILLNSERARELWLPALREAKLLEVEDTITTQ